MGADLIKDGSVILTYIAMQALLLPAVTERYGTDAYCKRAGAGSSVYLPMRRDLLQGARLTVWSLCRQAYRSRLSRQFCRCPYEEGEVDMVIVGTDRTVRNGDVANKIGTYTLAVLAKENNIPFLCGCALEQHDFTMPEGNMIPIEERILQSTRDIREITTGASTGSWGAVRIRPDGVSVKNIAFDVTPARYVTV